MAGVTFTLESAQKIADTVRRVRNMPVDLTSLPSPSSIPSGTFWAMLTGASDLAGKIWDWVAVQPNPSGMSTPADSTDILASNMWQFADPPVVGWANAREVNDNVGVPPGTVVRLSFLGYVPGQVDPSGHVISGTVTTAGGSTSDVVGADGLVPFYGFTFIVPQVSTVVPIHDHRSNFAGGFSFSIYHPGTSLPQQNFST